MSTHNIGFYEDLTKIIFKLSSNMHLISSADRRGSKDQTKEVGYAHMNIIRCNTGKKFPIGRNANYLTLGHSQVLANVA